jgi:plastocyanin
MPDRRRWALVAVAVALAGTVATLSGCATAPARAAQAQAVRTTEVDLPPSYVFAPASIEVAAGSTVTWTNHDNFSHSVQVQGQSEVHLMRSGETAQIRFDTPGTYAYVCTLHTQNMRGTVLVST